MRSVLRLLAFGGATLLLASCASTSMQSAWFDSNFKGGPFRKLVVVGAGANTADRRVFEDIFVERLRAAGVDAVAGYQVIPNEARAGEDPFTQAIERSGATGALMVRLMDVDTRTQVSTMMVPNQGFGGPWGGPLGGGPWGGAGFYGPTWSAVPVVSQYELANVEVKLFDVKARQLVWAGNTQTFNPTTVARETPGFAAIIIAQLQARGLIVAAPK